MLELFRVMTDQNALGQIVRRGAISTVVGITRHGPTKGGGSAHEWWRLRCSYSGRHARQREHGDAGMDVPTRGWMFPVQGEGG